LVWRETSCFVKEIGPLLLVLYEREVKKTNLKDRRIDCDISEVCVSIEVLLKCVLFVLAFQYEKRDVEGGKSE
jgi:hypothetical protein